MLPQMLSSPSAGYGWNSSSTTSWGGTWASFPRLSRARSSCRDSQTSSLPAGIWLLPDPESTRLVREDRLAKEEVLADRPAAGRYRLHLILQRDALIAERIRAGAALAGRPVIEVPPSPDWPAIAAGVEAALAAALRSAPHLAPGSELSLQRRYENRAADRQGRLLDAGRRACRDAFVPVRL